MGKIHYIYRIKNWKIITRTRFSIPLIRSNSKLHISCRFINFIIPFTNSKTTKQAHEIVDLDLFLRFHFHLKSLGFYQNTQLLFLMPTHTPYYPNSILIWSSITEHRLIFCTCHHCRLPLKISISSKFKCLSYT